MTAPIPEDVHPVLERYRARLGAVVPAADELLTSHGVRPGSLDLAASIALLGVPGLPTRREQARRFVEDDGVPYGSPPLVTRNRRWAVDPLPLVLDSDEWAALEPALA